jgi:hypothetical protein
MQLPLPPDHRQANLQHQNNFGHLGQAPFTESCASDIPQLVITAAACSHPQTNKLVPNQSAGARKERGVEELCTWKRMVRRARGAVQVLLTTPASPPAARCAAAWFPRCTYK